MSSSAVTAKLQTLSLINRITNELNNHLNLSDRTLSEYIIHRAEKRIEKCAAKKKKSTTFTDVDLLDEKVTTQFQNDLKKKGAEFPSSFLSHILHVVFEMSPRLEYLKKQQQQTTEPDNVIRSSSSPIKQQQQQQQHDPPPISSSSTSFPGLARQNVDPVKLDSNFYDHEEAKVYGCYTSSSTTTTTNNVLVTQNNKFTSSPSDFIVGGIYKARIVKLMEYGAFLILHKNKERDNNNNNGDDDDDDDDEMEGFVHVSQIVESRGGGARVKVSDVLQIHQSVYAKILSIEEQQDPSRRSGGGGGGGKKRVSTSLKEVDQVTGQDLKPTRRSRIVDEQRSLPHHHHQSRPLSTEAADHHKTNSSKKRRRGTELTEQELFEAQQLKRSGVLIMMMILSFYTTFSVFSLL